MKNAKTTIAGILTMVLPILAMLLKWLNGEAITGADLTMLGSGATAGGGLFFARDAATKEVTIVQPLSGVGGTVKTSL